MADGRRRIRKLVPWIAWTLAALLVASLYVPNEIGSGGSQWTDTQTDLHMRCQEARLLRRQDPPHWHEILLAETRAAFDAWGTPLRARVEDDDSFEIASAGADEEWGTADDLVMRVDGPDRSIPSRRAR